MLETPATPHNEDLDKDDRQDKWRMAVWILVFLLIGSTTWILLAQNNTAQIKAASEASQKFTLAQQVAAACALKTQKDDLGGLCVKAEQLVKEGPTGSTGPQGDPGINGTQGPLGPKGEPGIQGIQGMLGATGTQGLFGKTGTNGAVGSQGTSGTNGKDGEPGTAGTAGTNGVSGPAGADGAPGATGADGKPAFPFTFTFKTTLESFTCVITASDATATCVAN